MEGIKHIIECHCVLPQYRNIKNPIYHKFIAFSIIDDSDTVISKFVQCNNCDVIHKIFDICKSEILSGKDELSAGINKEDIKKTLSNDVIDVLDSYDADLATYENVAFILKEKKWGSFVVLTKDTIEDEVAGKMLVFENHDKFKIESFINRTIVQR